MKVLKPYIHIEIIEEKKSAIILSGDIDLRNKQAVVTAAHAESILAKGDVLVLRENTRLNRFLDPNGAELFFIDERDVVAAI